MARARTAPLYITKAIFEEIAAEHRNRSLSSAFPKECESEHESEAFRKEKGIRNVNDF